MIHDNNDDISQNMICDICVGESYFSDIIKKVGTVSDCSYCDNNSTAIPICDAADIIEKAFEDHFTRTAQEPDGYQWAAMKDPESSYDWERDGEQCVYAIMNAAEIPEDAAHDIQQILEERHSDYEAAQLGEETEFDSEAYYEEKAPSDWEWQWSWHAFEKGIKTEARFFSRTASAQLGALFDDIDNLRSRRGGPLIVQAGPGTAMTHLYRARVFQSEDKLREALKRPDKDIAAPPSHLAASGRMNARGIAAFYGATTSEIAIAEVRPPVGSQVAVAKFDLTRQLNLLDLALLKDVSVVGSIFDPQHAGELGRMMFLRKLCDRIVRPIMPDDQESEYLTTQAIADYLATEGRVPLDGIIYPSVQAGSEGLNVVLFHKASRCQELVIPDLIETDARTYQDYESGPEPDYTVIDWIKSKDSSETDEDGSKKSKSIISSTDRDYFPTSDTREPTLKVDLDTVSVHVIRAVNFVADEHTVRRYKWERSSFHANQPKLDFDI